MGQISPLYLNYESIRRPFELPPNWGAEVARHTPSSMLHEAAARSLGGWITWIVGEFHVNSFAADQVIVWRQLRELRKQVADVGHNPNAGRIERLCKRLTYPIDRGTPVFKARMVILDYLCTALLVDPEPGWILNDRTLWPSADMSLFGSDASR
jgi:hypothetical protein